MPLGDLRLLGRHWATQAGKEVLQNIDQPSFESVQTCEMLTLYWFSAGESQRNTMFSGMYLHGLPWPLTSADLYNRPGIAYKAACTLGLDNSDPIPSSTEASPVEGSNARWLEEEGVRRCFWAVWFTQCINSDHDALGTTYNDRVLNLPLPIAETSFTQGVPQPLVKLSTVLEQRQTTKPVTVEAATPSILAELMTLIFYWYVSKHERDPC